MIDLETLIHDALERNASDIHLTVGEPPIFRLDGELTNFGEVPLTEADTTAYVQELITPGLLKEFHEMGEADFAVTYHDLVRMRCNVFRQRGMTSLALRLLPLRIATAEELGLPPVVVAQADKPRGQVAQIFYRLLKEQKVSSKSTFTDVPDTLWCAEAVNALASLGIVEGVGNGKFAPNQPITRAEFVTICARFTQVSASGETFTDVPASHWAFDAISTAASFGWVNGVGNGQFAPNQHITRAQAAVLLNRLLGRCMAGQSYENARQYPDVPQTHWAWKNICEASDGVALR